MTNITYTDEYGNVIAVNCDASFVPAKGDSVSFYDQVEEKQVYYQVLFRSITEVGHPRSDGILDTQHEYVTVALEEMER